MMILLIDMDEVLVDTATGWLTRYNADWNDNLTVNDIKSWNWHEWVKPECGMKVYDYLFEKGFFKSLKPRLDAISSMNYLLGCKDLDICIVTASPLGSKYGYEDKKEWIMKHLPAFPLKNYMPIHRKDLVSGDIMFDDGPHNLRSFNGIAIAQSMPWNDETCCDASVKTWKEFVELIDLMRTKFSGAYEDYLHKAKERYRKFSSSVDTWRYEQQWNI